MESAHNALETQRPTSAREGESDGAQAPPEGHRAAVAEGMPFIDVELAVEPAGAPPVCEQVELGTLALGKQVEGPDGVLEVERPSDPAVTARLDEPNSLPPVGGASLYDGEVVHVLAAGHERSNSRQEARPA